jgi:hypothetical protein
MTEKPFKLILRVVWWMQILQIAFALPFTAISIYVVMSFLKGTSVSFGLFLFLVAMAYLGWANALSTIQVTDDSVTVTVLYGRFRVYWNEVEEIVLNNPLVALVGNNKRVVLSLALMDKNKEKLLEFFGQQIKQENILFEENVIPFPITHQNARVWW